LPERPTGRARTQADREGYLEKSRGFWRSLDPDEKEGLQYLTGFLGLNIMSSNMPSSFELQRLHHQIMSQIGKGNPADLPEEFIVQLGTEERLEVLVKVDKSRKMLSYTIFAPDAESI